MRYILIAAALSLPLIACNNAGETEDAAGSGGMATDAASSQTTMAPAGAPSSASSVADYLPAAAIGDMYEIQAAEIALERSQNTEVQALARMIRDDHTQASERMKGLVPQAAPDVRLPTTLDDRHQQLVTALRDAPAEGFDRVYLQQQVTAHEEALALHQSFSQNTEAPQLAEHARSVVAPIERHLEQARTLMTNASQPS